jgi:hypothetical protein
MRRMKLQKAPIRLVNKKKSFRVQKIIVGLRFLEFYFNRQIDQEKIL